MMKDSQSDSLLTLKCELLFQMIEQSCPSLLNTLTIGFIPISSKRLLCNIDYKPMFLVKNWHRHLVLSRDYFLNYLKQHDEKTVLLKFL